MKRSDFLKILIFLLGFLLLNQALGRLFVYWSRSSYGYEVSRREFEAMQDQVTVIVLGDSHVMLSVDVNDIEGGYNLATTAENYILTYYKVRYYLERGQFHPSVAIIPIDLHDFMLWRFNSIRKHDPSYWSKYVDYLELGRRTNTLQVQILTYMNGKFALLNGLDVLGMAFWQEPNVNDLSPTLGFAPWNKDFSAMTVDAQEQLSQIRVDTMIGHGSHIDNYMKDYFLRLLDLLEDYDVQVVLVWFPVTEMYYEDSRVFIDPDAHLETIRELVAGRQSVTILDYHDVFYGHLDYFSDPHHLNLRGAEILTNLLIGDLNEAGLLPVQTKGD